MSQLILTRKHQSSITLDGPGKVTVLIRGGRVQLAIDAPLTTNILRDDAVTPTPKQRQHESQN